MATKKAEKDNTILVPQVSKTTMEMWVLGTKGLIINRINDKAIRQLLLPTGPKTKMEKQSNLKHDSLDEFRSSAYLAAGDEEPTLLQLPAVCFKRSMVGAARDLPGVQMTTTGRLIWVYGEHESEYGQRERVSIYGLPKMYMSPVRDANGTPDIRTRVIVPRWATRLCIEYVTPIINQKSAINLLACAGVTNGVGDWRAEKGSNNHGSFEIVNDDDPRVKAIVKEGSRKAQKEAMEKAEPYNDDTAELYAWFVSEIDRRGWTRNADGILVLREDASKKNGKRLTDVEDEQEEVTA